MFKYVGDLSNIAQNVINTYIEDKAIAIDATLGNGHDTDFLSKEFQKVYSFDIQEIAVENYKKKKRENVVLINDSHHKLREYVREDVDCVMYNLGFLPGGDKTITTTWETTLKSIEVALDMIKSGGIITIGIYIGHNEGENEGNKVLQFLENLPKNKYGVLLHKFINRSKSAPMLAIIEKK